MIHHSTQQLESPAVDWTAQADRAPQLYEEFLVPAIFAPVAAALVDRAGVTPGMRVLDVACGTGIVSRTAACVVGVTGAVTGVDISPGMLAVAVERSAGDGAAPIEYVTGSAEDPPVSRGRFDVVLCQQGLQFFADRAAALTAMHDALEPGGRVGIATWTDLDGATAFSAEVEAIELHLGPEVAARMRSPFSLSDPAEVEAMVRAAGFVDIQVTRHTFTARYSRREFARRVVLAGPVSAEFAGASADCQERIVSHITSAVAACDGDAYGLRHAMTSNLITATKPAAVSD